MTDAVTVVETPPVAVVTDPITPPVAAPAAITPPAPVVPPVTLPIAETPPVEAGVTYEPTGDAGLDVALAFVGALGVSGEHPAMVAAGQGDFSLLKAHLATLGDKARGFEQMVALGEDAYTRATTKAADAAAAVTSAVHAIAGSAEEWGKIQAWAALNATPAEKAELNALFDTNAFGARAAAITLKGLYQKAVGTVVEPASATTANAGAGTAVATNGPLAPHEYHTAVRDLYAKLGNRMDASPEYAALRARLRR